MSETEADRGRLFELYAQYVGEPDSKKDVYGYWFYFLGSVTAFAGIAVVMISWTLWQSLELIGQGLHTQIMQFAYMMAATGLVFALFGLVLLLPVKRWGIGLALIGTLVSLGAIGWFTQVFPGHWPPGADSDVWMQVVAAYAGGVGVIAGVAMMIPVFTGEKSFFFESEYERSEEYPPVEIGEALNGGMFSVYRGDEEWEWRLIEQNAVAGSMESWLARLEAESSVDHMKDKVADARLLEIKQAAFRIYEAAEGSWRWVLMRGDGSVVANSDDEFDSRDTVGTAVNDLKEKGPDAEIIKIEEGGAFDFTRKKGKVHWRLVDDRRVVLSESAAGFNGRSGAKSDLETARKAAKDARTIAVEDFGVELYKRGEDETGIEVYDEEAAAADEIDHGGASTSGPWNWRLLDAEDTVLAINQDGFDSRRAVEERVYDVLKDIPAAPVLDATQPGYEVARDGGSWTWRLLDDTEQVVARPHGSPGNRDGAENSARQVRKQAGDADVVSIDQAEFEYFRTSEGWRWRLVTETREIVAESIEAFDSRQDAADAIERVKNMAQEADLIEFENAAFQLYEFQGEWRWRLIDEDGNVMADSGEEHGSRDSAAASMMTIKEQAPDAEVLEVESAAFELFHDDDGNWNWRLVDISGETVARGPQMVDSREEARTNMDKLTDTANVSDARAMETAAFQVYANDAGEWRWRLVHPDGSILADSEQTYATRDEATTTIQSSIQPAASGADIDVIESLALQIDARGERYTWRLLDAQHETVAASMRSYVDRSEVTDELDRLKAHAENATVFEMKGYTFYLNRPEGTWSWRLVDTERDELMRAPESYESQDAAEASVKHVQDVVEDAEIIDFDDAAFEVYQNEEDERWRWQLIDEEENVMASGSRDYETRKKVEETIEAIRNELEGAQILEIEGTAFELVESEGEWGWRLLDENGEVLARSLQAYDSRAEAVAARDFVKSQAPDALAQVAE